MSRVLMLQGKYDRAIDEAELSIAINPSSTVAHLFLAFALYWGGRADEAVPIVDTSMRLSPKGPYREFKLLCKVYCFYALGRLDEAAALAQPVAHAPTVGPIGLMVLSAILARLGRLEEAKAAAAELVEGWPEFRISRMQRSWHSLVPQYRDQFLQDLKAAGLPE